MNVCTCEKNLTYHIKSSFSIEWNIDYFVKRGGLKSYYFQFFKRTDTNATEFHINYNTGGYYWRKITNISSVKEDLVCSFCKNVCFTKKELIQFVLLSKFSKNAIKDFLKLTKKIQVDKAYVYALETSDFVI